MPTYYCYKCVRECGLVAPVNDSTALTASQYQLDKFIKHTAPTGVYPTNSVFLDTSWSTYQRYIVTTASSGSLEIDDQGRKNLIYFAGRDTGLRYVNGLFTATCSGVVLVCSENTGRLHAFPGDFQPESRKCAICGEAVPFDPRRAGSSS